jgi:ketosteroid isomerase-like protein
MMLRLRSTFLLPIFLLSTVVFATSLSLPAQSTQLKTASQQELDVIKVLLKQEAAWNRGDLDGFAEGYMNSPDTLFINNQIQRGFSKMVAAYHHDYPSKEAMGQLSFSELEVYPIDEKVAACIGRYRLERSKKNGGNAEGLFSMVLEKTENGWKIVVDHTT